MYSNIKLVEEFELDLKKLLNEGKEEPESLKAFDKLENHHDSGFDFENINSPEDDDEEREEDEEKDDKFNESTEISRKLLTELSDELDEDDDEDFDGDGEDDIDPDDLDDLHLGTADSEIEELSDEDEEDEQEDPVLKEATMLEGVIEPGDDECSQKEIKAAKKKNPNPKMIEGADADCEDIDSLLEDVEDSFLTEDWNEKYKAKHHKSGDAEVKPLQDVLDELDVLDEDVSDILDDVEDIEWDKEDDTYRNDRSYPGDEDGDDIDGISDITLDGEECDGDSDDDCDEDDEMLDEMYDILNSIE